MTIRRLRNDVLESANSSKPFDVVVVGGGVHGAYSALLLGTAGLRTLLLERSDFGSETSSRSTKLAHGGLRYLQTFDFRQVVEGVRAREGLFQQAPHLVSPQRFLIPIERGGWKDRVMLKAGLTLYDFFVRDRERRHRWIPASDLAQVTSVLRTPISGAFEYCDGQMNDVRIVLEHIEAARRVGAVCVNYAEVEAIESGASFAEIRYRDRVSQALHTITSKAVLSCAGPWGEKLVPDARNSMRFSRGAHIVFRTPWGRPPLFLPIRGAGPGRYYFVLPHFAGTLVGTTEAEVEEPSFHPLPTPLEVAEILQRLKDDLPKADLTAETAHYAFAGIRALPVRGQARSVSRVARRHVWEQVGRVVTLFGGKYTTYQWTAGEGVKYILSMLGMSEKLRLPLHPFPYFVSVAERRELQQKVLQRAPGISPETLDRLITRLGSSLEGFLDQPHLWEELLPGICAVEVAQAVAVDQAISPSDILLRRLETISFPDFGEVLLPQILEQLVAAGVDRTFVEREGVSLKAEFAEVRSLLNNHSR